MKKSELTYLDIKYDVGTVVDEKATISIMILPKNNIVNPNNDYKKYLIELKDLLKFVADSLDDISGALYDINDQENYKSNKDRNYNSNAQTLKKEAFKGFLERLTKDKNDIVTDIFKNLHDGYKKLTNNVEISYYVNVDLHPSYNGNSVIIAGLKNMLNSFNRICNNKECLTVFTQDQMKGLLFHRRLLEGSLFQIFGKHGYGIGSDAFPIIEEVLILNQELKGGKSRKAMTQKPKIKQSKKTGNNKKSISQPPKK
jgi:hypothetical protein